MTATPSFPKILVTYRMQIALDYLPKKMRIMEIIWGVIVWGFIPENQSALMASNLAF